MEPETVKKYIVQARFNYAGRLHTVGTFTARSALGAIAQAAKMLANNGEDCQALVSTEQPE